MRHVQLGIIGSMGPEADELMQAHIRRASGAVNDQEHIPMVVVKNPEIPDRTAAILNGGADPVPEIVRSAKRLEGAGVFLAVMPCNTSHYFHARIQAQTSVYILDMPATVAATLNPKNSVGLLATTGTIQSGLYQQYAGRYGIDMVIPNDDIQERCVHSAIYGTKNNKGERLPTGIKASVYADNEDALVEAIEHMNRPSVIILGCTELPLIGDALKRRFPDITFIDPMEVAALRLVHIYRLAEQHCKNAIPNPLLARNDEEISRYVASHAAHRHTISTLYC